MRKLHRPRRSTVRSGITTAQLHRSYWYTVRAGAPYAQIRRKRRYTESAGTNYAQVHRTITLTLPQSDKRERERGRETGRSFGVEGTTVLAHRGDVARRGWRAGWHARPDAPSQRERATGRSLLGARRLQRDQRETRVVTG